MISAAVAALEDLGVLDELTQSRLLRWLRLADSVDLDAGVFGRLLQIDSTEAQMLADALVRYGVFEQSDVFECIGEECGVALSDESLAEGQCRRCGTNLSDLPPRTTTRYRITQPRARDVGWLIALHGIRTHGGWQEQLQWLVDREYLRTVPFRNWKYGRIFLGALVPSLQRRFVARFVHDVHSSARQLDGVLGRVPPPPPDVVAHSFGTWIVAHALEEDPDLRLGHVVLVGSIVRPDWNWKPLLERGQLTAVLNYCGDRDPWVRLAERFIPDSGPSGRVGFEDEDDRVTNILNPGGRHSSTFQEDALVVAFGDVWRPFLHGRAADIELGVHELLPAHRWNRARRFLRAPVSVGLAAAVLIATVSLVVASFFVSGWR